MASVGGNGIGGGQPGDIATRARTPNHKMMEIDDALPIPERCHLSITDNSNDGRGINDDTQILKDCKLSGYPTIAMTSHKKKLTEPSGQQSEVKNKHANHDNDDDTNNITDTEKADGSSAAPMHAFSTRS